MVVMAIPEQYLEEGSPESTQHNSEAQDTVRALDSLHLKWFLAECIRNTTAAVPTSEMEGDIHRGKPFQFLPTLPFLSHQPGVQYMCLPKSVHWQKRSPISVFTNQDSLQVWKGCNRPKSHGCSKESPLRGRESP